MTQALAPSHRRSRLGQTALPASSARARALVVVLVLLSFGLHMWRIEAKSIWWDESLSLYRAQRSVLYILSNRIDFPGSSTTDLHPPLYFLLLHLLTRLCGETDLVLRFPSVAFAALIVPLLYLMGRRLRGARAGLLAALFGALSPFYLWYAQEARMYAMVTALGLASVYFLWRAFTEQSWAWALAYGLAASAAMATQYLFALVIASEVLLAVFLWPRQGLSAVGKGETSASQRRSSWLWGAAVLLVVLPILAYEAVGLAVWPKAGRWYVSPGIMVRDALNSFSLGLSVDLRDIWFLDVLFLAAFVIGVASIWRRPPRIRIHQGQNAIPYCRGAGLVVLAGYILIPILGMWLYSLLVPMYMGSRYVIMCSPAFYLGLGVGLDSLAGSKRGLARTLGIVLVASMSVSVHRYYYHERYRTKEDYRSAAQYIAVNERVGDGILVTAPENLTAFIHYYEGGLPVGGMPSVSLSAGPDPARLARDMGEWIQPYDRIWLVHCRTQHSDPEDLVTRWLDRETTLLGRKIFPSYGSFVTVSAYTPRPPIQGQESAHLEAIGSFGQRLALLDSKIRYWSTRGEVYETSLAEGSRSVETTREQFTLAPGKAISAVMTWLPQRELGNYKTSLRLLDSRGALWAQRDRPPFEYFPTHQWPIGARIRHEADLPIPPGTPPGVYHLQLWVYEAESLRSLSFQEPAGGREHAFADLGPIVIGEAQKPFPLWAFVPAGAQTTRWATVFGGDLELLAHQVSPRSVEPGEGLELHLYWRARAAITRDYQVALNWENDSGEVWHTTTHSPTGTNYPTSRWGAGAMLRGLLRLRVPEEALPGRHKLHLLVGVRGSEELLWLRRGPIPWAGRNLAIAEITVQ